MKKTFLVVIFFIGIYACNHQAKTKVENNTNAKLINQDFDWLIGKWIRTNDQENKTTFENWEKVNNSEYSGFSYTMQNNDTIWQENIKLINTGNNWSFNVTEKEEIEPTKFALFVIEKRKFICENQANEFPKTIDYSIEGDKLLAKIAGNDMEVLFDFKKAD